MEISFGPLTVSSVNGKVMVTNNYVFPFENFSLGFRCDSFLKYVSCQGNIAYN